MPASRLLIVGAGGHGRSVAEAAVLSGQYELAGFVDDGMAVGSAIWHTSVLGSTADLKAYAALCDKVVVAIGNNALRESLVTRLVGLGFELTTVIHPKAIVSPSAVIGQGCAIMAGAIVGTEAHLGLGVIANCGSVVDHHAQVHEFGHLGVNACMAGGAILGRKAWMQAGSALGYGAQVPADAVLAPGVALTGK
jgi:sugar O-acyltransferase (sialic acid O-acetyltransferase NeuD family)